MLADTRWTWAGRLPMARAIEANLAAAAACRAGDPPAVLMFEPAAPVFTLGRRAATSSGREELAHYLALCRDREVAVMPVDRGGLGTLHLPGQLVCFVAVPCRRSRITALVVHLLDAARQVAIAGGLQAWREDGDRIGLWGTEGKFASIGLRLDRGVACHGLSLNIDVDRALAAGLSLCGDPATRLADLRHATRAVPDAASCPILTAEDAAVALAAALDLKTGQPRCG